MRACAATVKLYPQGTPLMLEEFLDEMTGQIAEFADYWRQVGFTGEIVPADWALAFRQWVGRR